MKSKDLFAAAMRIIGILSFGRGFVDLLYVLLFTFNLTDSSALTRFPYNNLLYGLFYFLGGLYLIRGAPLVVNFAYPDEIKIREDEKMKENPLSTEG